MHTCFFSQGKRDLIWQETLVHCKGRSAYTSRIAPGFPSQTVHQGYALISCSISSLCVHYDWWLSLPSHHGILIDAMVSSPLLSWYYIILEFLADHLTLNSLVDIEFFVWSGREGRKERRRIIYISWFKPGSIHHRLHISYKDDKWMYRNWTLKQNNVFFLKLHGSAFPL